MEKSMGTKGLDTERRVVMPKAGAAGSTGWIVRRAALIHNPCNGVSIKVARSRKEIMHNNPVFMV